MTPLACPNCKSGEDLGTVETLIAVALLGGMDRDDEGNFVPDYCGESDVVWDTQTWDGKLVSCRRCCIDFPPGDLVPLVPE